MKTLEVLAKITVPVEGEEGCRDKATPSNATGVTQMEFPMDRTSIEYAMKNVRGKSRDRGVFSALIQLHADNEWLFANLSSIMSYMCKLQPPEFVLVSFAVELHSFINHKEKFVWDIDTPVPGDLKFMSAFIQNINHVLFNTDEARTLRDTLKDCIAYKSDADDCYERSLLFQILHHSFSHNIAATVTLCLWVGAYRTAHCVINTINPLDINLMFLLEIDRLIELLERPLLRLVPFHLWKILLSLCDAFC